MARNYAPLPHEYLTAMSKLNDAEFGRLIRWLLIYSSTGRLAPLDGKESILCPMVQMREDQFQASFRETDTARSAAAKKAAEKRWSMHEDASACAGMREDASDAKTKTKTNTSPSIEGRRGRKFTPPTVEEVRAYCTERRNGIDPARFCDYYTANGWVQGQGKPIKDWRATVRTWERRNTAPQAGTPAAPGGYTVPQNARKNAEAMRRLLEEDKTDEA